MSRIRKFFVSVYACRQAHIPLDRRNLRALWLQTDNWLYREPLIDLSDEEWERFMEAIS